MFCKYCGQQLSKGAFCGRCGKENILMKSSTDLDALMKNQVVKKTIKHDPVPEKPEHGSGLVSEKTYQQGLTEGYVNGKNEGYEAGKEAGKRAGYEAGQRAASARMPWYVKKAPILCGIIAAVLVVAIATTGILANSAGYKRGLTTGEQIGRVAASNEMQSNYDAAVLVAQQDYEARLGQHYEAGYAQGKLDAEAAMPTLTPVPVATPTPNTDTNIRDYVFKKGARGNAVKGIQQLLVDKGWKIAVDGQYGSGTVKAVKEFQQRNQLTETGEVDILTYWALLSNDSVGYTTASPSTPAPSPTPTAEVKTPTPEEVVTPSVPSPIPSPEATDIDQLSTDVPSQHSDMPGVGITQEPLVHDDDTFDDEQQV